MSTQVPTKIVLKSTTKMSLNDRFTSIQQRAQPTVQNIRSNMVAQQQASAANRRLAQQLANRPGVNLNPYQGAGMSGGVGGGIGGMDHMGGPMGMGMLPPQQQRSLKQRLGRGNIKARLNLDAVGRGGPPMGMRGRGQPQGNFNNRGGFRGGRGGQGNPMQQQMMRGGRGGRGSPRGMNTFSRGQPGGRGGRGGMRGNFNRYPPEGFGPSSGWWGRGQGGRNQRRGGRYQGDRNNTRGGPGGGGGQPRGGRGGFRGQGMTRGGRGRGGPGGMRGGGRGRGGRGGGNKEGGVSREQLDNQLDEYMSKTKSHLDAELDTYMAEANP